MPKLGWRTGIASGSLGGLGVRGGPGVEVAGDMAEKASYGT